MVKKRKNKIKVGVTCQCKKPAVSSSYTHLRKVQCKKCGIIFRTNRDRDRKGYDLCFRCRSKG